MAACGHVIKLTDYFNFDVKRSPSIVSKDAENDILILWANQETTMSEFR